MADDHGGGYFVLGFEFEELDALVLRPAARMDLVSMRMILPNWLMTMSSVVSSTRLMVTFPILRAVFKTEFPKWESREASAIKGSWSRERKFF